MNVRNAIQRAQVKKTMMALKATGLAIEKWADQNGDYPTAKAVNELAALLQRAKVIDKVDITDAWGHPLRYAYWRPTVSAPGRGEYVLASPGRDGIWEHDDLRVYEVRGFDENEYDPDIVYRTGRFQTWPASSP